MKHLLLASCLLLSLCYSHDLYSQSKNWVYVSTYDIETPTGIGIYSWDASNGDLSFGGNDSTVSATSYLTINKKNSKLYAVNQEGIHAFGINRKSGALEFVNSVKHNGKGACYISLSNGGKYLLVAYYVSGSVASYALNDEGEIGKCVSTVEHKGASVNADRQKSAHAHMIIPAPQGDLVYVTDLGTDEVRTYRLSASGEFSEPVSVTKVNPGYGPRHLVFHPQQPYVYVLAELTGHVLTYRYDSVKGITEKIDEDSILSADFSGFNKSADIHITPDGKYLYASNRGPNTIAVAKIDERSGTLEIKNQLNSGGEWPRAFEVDSSGKYLLVANKRSHTISVMQIDQATGQFKKIKEVKTANAPQCIKFLPRK